MLKAFGLIGFTRLRVEEFLVLRLRRVRDTSPDLGGFPGLGGLGLLERYYPCLHYEYYWGLGFRVSLPLGALGFLGLAGFIGLGVSGLG